MDASRNFLRILVEPEDADLDFVAVHGLNPFKTGSNAISTWTADNGKIWIKDPDFLPAKFPRARVLLFGYNSNPAFASSSAGLDEQAKNLLFNMKLYRANCASRPVIFICHSLGGLLVKRALVIAWNIESVYKQTYDAIRGIVFFGVPHGGGSKVGLGKIAASIARFCCNKPSNSFLQSLEDNDFFAESNRDAFLQRAHDFEILSFYESNKLKGVHMVVDRKDAVLGLPDDKEPKIAMDADHSQICKFSDSKGDTFELVWRSLDVMYKRALESAPLAKPELNTLPFDSDEDFCGRDDLLEDIHNSLNKRQAGQRRCALIGISGVGKSSAAVQYAIRFSSEYRGIFYASAESESTLQRDFDAINSEVTTKTSKNLREWTKDLEKHWLLIIDNYDDPNVFSPARYIPNTRNGHILFTSTREDISSIGEVIHVPPLDKTNARDLLLQISKGREEDENDLDDATRIVQMLACLPLAIVQCGSLLSNERERLCDYPKEFDLLMQKLEPSGAEFEDQDRFSWNRSKTILTTWEISYQRLSKVDANAALLLSIITYLQGYDIAEHVLVNGAAKHRRWDSVGNVTIDLIRPIPVALESLCSVPDGKAVKSAIRKLLAYSLLFEKRSSGNYLVHPLIHYWLRARKDQVYQETAFHHAIYFLANGYPDPEFGPTFGLPMLLRDRFMAYQGHLMRLAEFYEAFPSLCSTSQILLGKLFVRDAKIRFDFQHEFATNVAYSVPGKYLQLIEQVLKKHPDETLWLEVILTFYHTNSLRAFIGKCKIDFDFALLSGLLKFADKTWQDVISAIHQQNTVQPEVENRHIPEFFRCKGGSVFKLGSCEHVEDLQIDFASLMPIPRTSASQSTYQSGLIGRVCAKIIRQWQGTSRYHSSVAFPGNLSVPCNELGWAHNLITIWDLENEPSVSDIELFVTAEMRQLDCLDIFQRMLFRFGRPSSERIEAYLAAQKSRGEPPDEEDLLDMGAALMLQYLENLDYILNHAISKLGRGSHIGVKMVIDGLWHIYRLRRDFTSLARNVINKSQQLLLAEPITDLDFHSRISFIYFLYSYLPAEGAEQELNLILKTSLDRFKACSSENRKHWTFSSDPVLDIYELLINYFDEVHADEAQASHFRAEYLAYTRLYYNDFHYKLCLGCEVGAFGTSRSRLRSDIPPYIDESLSNNASEEPGSVYCVVDKFIRKYRRPKESFSSTDDEFAFSLALSQFADNLLGYVRPREIFKLPVRSHGEEGSVSDKIDVYYKELIDAYDQAGPEGKFEEPEGYLVVI